ncbi:TPA: hypothetical protein PL519_003463 [Clostridium botulinum]|nr:hypothetical protein [Clostridium botulinum]
MEEKKLRKNNFIRQIIKNFFLKLEEREFKKIVILDIYRCFKILATIWGYMLWLLIAQIGFNNLYAIAKIFEINEFSKPVVNSFGNASFIVLLSTLIVFIALEFIRLGFQPSDYIRLLCSLKNKLSSVLRLGTLIFLIGIYTHEIEMKLYRNILIYVVFQLSLFWIFALLEKITFNQIKKGIEKDIEIKNFCIETAFGILNDIPLQVFSIESKWQKYIFRSKHYGKSIFYNEEIYGSLKDTNALRGNEPLVLKDFFGDYEMTIVPTKRNNKND